MLALGDDVLLERPYSERRAALEGIDGLELTPVVVRAGDAQQWLQRRGGRDRQGGRLRRTCPASGAGWSRSSACGRSTRSSSGWRPGKAENTVGAIILGLYGDDGRLREVGHSSGFTAKRKRELVAELAPYETGERGSGEPSRWTAGRDLEWVALRPELVVEITFDHVSDGRIRHGTKVVRWRDDKPPADCKLDQLES